MRMLILALLLLGVPAWAAEPHLRLLPEPDGPLQPGQGLVLRVQLLAPNYFLSPPSFPNLQLNDGSRGTADGTSLNLVERDGEQSFAGIERTYRFPPRPSGTYQLQPAEMALRFADDQGRPVEARISFPALRVKVAEKATTAVQEQDSGKAQLQISEEYQPQLTELRSGDILIRRIRIELHDAGSLLPPAPQLIAPDGVRLYRRAPQLERDEQRVGQTVSRYEEVRYLFEQPGNLELPAVRLDWRSTRTGQLESLELPARQLSIASQEDLRMSDGSRPWVIIAEGLLLSGLLGALLYLHRRQGWPVWPPCLLDWLDERRHWRAFRQACRSGQAQAVEKALEQWLQHSPLPDPLSHQHDTALGREIQALLRQRYAASTTTWQAMTLYREARRVRSTLHTGDRQAVDRHSQLNPPEH